MRVAFHENNRNHENDENNSDSCKQGVECWINGNPGNHGMTKTAEIQGCKQWLPQVAGLEIPLGAAAAQLLKPLYEIAKFLSKTVLHDEAFLFQDVLPAVVHPIFRSGKTDLVQLEKCFKSF